MERVRIAQFLPDRAVLQRDSLQLSVGTTGHRYCAEEAQVLRQVPGTMVVLKLQRTLDPSAPTREYRMSDGVLLHQAAGSPRESRLELTAALLGRACLALGRDARGDRGHQPWLHPHPGG